VKSFQPSMMLSTVMQERNRQIKLKRKKKSHNQQMDAMWLQIQKENLEQQYKKEEAEEKMRKEKSMKLAKIQQHQVLLSPLPPSSPPPLRPPSPPPSHHHNCHHCYHCHHIISTSPLCCVLLPRGR